VAEAGIYSIELSGTDKSVPFQNRASMSFSAARKAVRIQLGLSARRDSLVRDFFEAGIEKARG